MTDRVYPVDVPETLAKHIAGFSEADRGEVLAGLARLRSQPLPGGAGGVWRLRVSDPLASPMLYSTTAKFGILHTVQDDRVLILAIHRRPTVRLDRS